ncbi:MAG: RHS repeat-associated core domain-containing protein [Prevotellaceae bacterium]|jgi:RHS repeat-associated protein|nr:RHS repeat-associated core domain-containing protein [Prevotellaceae bacterium]
MKHSIILIGIILSSFCINISAQNSLKLATLESVQEIKIDVNIKKGDIEDDPVSEKEEIALLLSEIDIVTTEIRSLLNQYNGEFDLSYYAVSLKDIENMIKYTYDLTLLDWHSILDQLRSVKTSLYYKLYNLTATDDNDEDIDRNYIRTRTFTTSATNPEYIDQIQYFDGLGRPDEFVQRKITPDQKDLISFLEYDDFGREFKQWLPTKFNKDDGKFVSLQSLSSRANLFHADSRPFAENIYENSPLNRVLGQKGTGAAWQNHPTNIAYTTNTATETPYFEVVGNQLKRTGNYAANTLYKTVSADEDGKTVTEFKNKLGRVVMTMQGNDNRTCYVYDNYGNLRYVLPPLAVDVLGNGTFADGNSTLADYAYIYKYDKRNRQIYKKLPGCEPVRMHYDKSDRMVLSQDGNQKNYSDRDEKLTATMYDVFGRVVYTAEILVGKTSVEGLTYNVSNTIITTELNNKNNDNPLEDTGYSKGYFASYPMKILNVYYYDNYDFLSFLDNDIAAELSYEDTQGEFDKVYGIYIANNMNTAVAPKTIFNIIATGLLTGTRSYLLDNSNTFLADAIYYDHKKQVVQSRATNYMQGFDIQYNKYNFTGTTAKTLKKHSASNNAAVKELYTYTYDHANRLTNTDYQLNNDRAVTLAQNTYDNLSRLTQKQRHNNTDNEQFAYNIKNWTTTIQSGNFEENLDYTGLFNGNIYTMQWANIDGNSYTYQFDYDELNRLNSGYLLGYRLPSNNGRLPGILRLMFREDFTYDKHGNIENLHRYSQGEIMDDLTLHYNGNQLEYVDETVPNSLDYYKKEYNKNRDEIMEYDDNGNLKIDLDRKIWKIEYNILNLPSRILFKGGHQINNIYAADGRKLESIYITQVTENINPLEMTIRDERNISEIAGTYYVGNIEYEYIDVGQRYAPQLSRIANAEGYVANKKYYYYRRDHLGNNREVWNATQNRTEQITNYYPSGLPWKTTQDENPDLQKYKYNGKEFIEDYGLDMYDYGARGYYAAIGRFTSVDPLAEIYYPITPYAYCSNDPINRIDPDGNADFYLPNGVWQRSDGVNDNKIYEIMPVSIIPIDQSMEGIKVKDIITFVGYAADVKITFTGQANVDDNNKSEGQLNVIQVAGNGKEYTRMSVTAVAGPYGNGSLENGDYDASNPHKSSTKGYVRDGFGFAIDLTPNFETGRSALQIHPDQAPDGTLGCIGIQENKKTLKSFYDFFKQSYERFGNINVNVNIENNPNNDGL